MRHQNSGRKLKRTASHRKATLAALCTALILHKKIKTTAAKAKETQKFVEKLITRAKNSVANETTTPDKKDVASRREVFAALRSREAVTGLFRDIATKVAARAGGYTRVVKLGRRYGDGAEMAILELVDFNVGQDKTAVKTAKKSTSRKKGAVKTKKSKAKTAVPEPAENKSAPDAEETNTGAPQTAEA